MQGRGLLLPYYYRGNIMPRNCESCEHYDYDEEIDDYVCKIDLDEDEYLDYLVCKNKDCPYYKYYDEYKSVQRQN